MILPEEPSSGKQIHRKTRTTTAQGARKAWKRRPKKLGHPARSPSESPSGLSGCRLVVFPSIAHAVSVTRGTPTARSRLLETGRRSNPASEGSLRSCSMSNPQLHPRHWAHLADNRTPTTCRHSLLIETERRCHREGFFFSLMI